MHNPETDVGPDTVRKRVAIKLPSGAELTGQNARYAPELEALAPIADLVDVPGHTADEIVKAAANCDAIITSRSIYISRDVIRRLDRCLVIGVGGVGVDMVDVDAATQAGIVVVNTPDLFIEEVADHAMLLLLAAARRVKEIDRMATSGDWSSGRALLSRMPRLLGRTLGLFSFGNIARRVAIRARAFGLRVIAHDPYVSELTMSDAGVEPVGWAELLGRSDYLSVHAPDNPETRQSLDACAFEQMQKGVILVNTARGSVIDESALIAALERGQVAAAGLDVLAEEPPDPANPLLAMPNVIVTPHVASASTRMRPAARRRVAREVALVLQGKWPMSCVNPAVPPKTPLQRWQPYPMARGPNR